MTEDILQFQVSNDQIFLKLAASAYQLPPLIENDAVAVKDQFVLPTDQVTESNDGHVVGRPGGQHPLSVAPFAGVVG